MRLILLALFACAPLRLLNKENRYDEANNALERWAHRGTVAHARTIQVPCDRPVRSRHCLIIRTVGEQCCDHMLAPSGMSSDCGRQFVLTV